MDEKLIFMGVYLIVGGITGIIQIQFKESRIFRWGIWIPFWGFFYTNSEIKKIIPQIHVQQWYALYQVSISIILFMVYLFI
jgi:hypothetical protein